MIQTIGLSVGAAVAYIIVVLGLMFYCKKRRHDKRLQKGQDGEEPEMECLNGINVWWGKNVYDLWLGSCKKISQEVNLSSCKSLNVTVLSVVERFRIFAAILCLSWVLHLTWKMPQVRINLMRL